MNINIVDDWLIAQHQKIVNWLSEQFDDISPYLIAANAFGLTSMFVILYYGYAFHVGRSISGEEPSTFYAALAIICGSSLTSLSFLKHSIYKRTKLPVPETTPFFDMILRYGWIFLAISGVINVFAKSDDLVSTTLHVLWAIYHAINLMGVYFLVCTPASGQKRWHRELAPQEF